MRKNGLTPNESDLEIIRLKTMKGESKISFDDKLAKIKNDLEEWNKKLFELFNGINLNNFENYYLNFFLGLNLVKLSKENLEHYLRFIKPDLQVENLFELEGTF